MIIGGGIMSYFKNAFVFLLTSAWISSLYATDCYQLRKDVLKNCKNFNPNLDLACQLAEGAVPSPEVYPDPIELEDHEGPEPDLPQSVKYEKPAPTNSDPGMDPSFIFSTCVGLCQSENRLDAFRVCCVSDFIDSITCEE